MSKDKGERIHVEHAFHLGEKAVARRRKLMGIGGTLAALSFVGAAAVASGDSDVKQANEAQVQAAEQQQLIKEITRPDSFNDGTYRIIISDSLNIRNAPIRQDGNTIEWSDIVKIEGKSITGAKSFDDDKPYIKTGQSPSNPNEKADWIELSVQVKNGAEIIDTDAFVAKTKETSEFVQELKSGTTKPLNQATEADLLGNVTINH